MLAGGLQPFDVSFGENSLAVYDTWNQSVLLRLGPFAEQFIAALLHALRLQSQFCLCGKMGGGKSDRAFGHELDMPEHEQAGRRDS